MTTDRIFSFKGILWVFTGLAAGVAIIRFTFGLGVSTALADTTPWGLWIGFDVMGGVALAAGGFVIAALVRIFHREKYQPAVRPAILTAFLGYAAVVMGLLFDLGLPWHIWHPVIFWNIRSALFEVAWCVMLYLAVLALEVAPVILERSRFQRTYRLLRGLGLPLIILGIMLSTLHQSSLGSLLLIMPFRVHPLWYSPRLPELFFVSAICLGLTMVMFESSITSWLYRRKPETEMLEGLARIASMALAIYLVFNLVDLAVQQKLGLLLAGTFERNLFAIEMLMSTLIPMVLYAVPRVRRSVTGMWLVSSCAVLGFLLNRINASGLSQVRATQFFYFPAWTEFAISLGIVSGCGLVFFFVQEHFPVEPARLAEMERDRQACLTAAPTGEPLVHRPVHRARGGDVLRIGTAPTYVYFNHRRHREDYGKETSCALCHHLHKAGDVGTPCSECHRSMHTATNIFDHTAHVAAIQEKPPCVKCHGEETPIVLKGMKVCQECHRKDMMVDNLVVKKFDSQQAVSYKNAMHGMCISCHVMLAADPSVKRPDLLARCGTCHLPGDSEQSGHGRPSGPVHHGRFAGGGLDHAGAGTGCQGTPSPRGVPGEAHHRYHLPPTGDRGPGAARGTQPG